MALALSLRIGHDFYAGGNRGVIHKILSVSDFTVRFDDGRVIKMESEKWVEPFPGIKMQAGIPRNQSSSKLIVLVIDAPGVTVVRGELYRKSTKVNCSSCNGLGMLTDKVTCTLCKGHGCKRCEGTGYTLSKFKCPDCS